MISAMMPKMKPMKRQTINNIPLAIDGLSYCHWFMLMSESERVDTLKEFNVVYKGRRRNENSDSI